MDKEGGPPFGVTDLGSTYLLKLSRSTPSFLFFDLDFTKITSHPFALTTWLTNLPTNHADLLSTARSL